MKFLLPLLMLGVSASVYAKECDSEKVIQKACDHFKKYKHQPLMKLKDGTHYVNPLFQGELPSALDMEVTEAQKTRVKKIFERAKAGIRQKIMNGVDESKLSAEKKNLLKRIDSVEMAKEQTKDTGPKCMAEPFNAFYVWQNNTVMICDGYYQYPEESLLFVLGHEISHSIDPCKSKSNLYKVSRDFVDQHVKGNEVDLEHWDQYFGENDYIYMSSKGPFQEFLANKKLNDKSDTELIAGAFVEGNYPYSGIKSCLINQKKFRNPSRKVNSEECSDDEINETMSDAFGTWAFSDQAGKYESSDSLFAVIGVAGPEVCDPKAAAPRSMTISKAEYPATYKRFKDVILQSSVLRQAFACEPDPQESCLGSASHKKPAQTSSKTQKANKASSKP